MKKVSKGLLMTALILGSSMAIGAQAYAADAPEEFSLDRVIVTATRNEAKDVDVPASTEVITKEDIQKTGSRNVAQALSTMQGLAYKEFGPAGASMGTMNNELSIRGIDNGTLVMVNGSPISWRGKYTLEAISTDNIERIEVVKGGNSVLYGSEAMAGVVNIITKKGGSNKVHAGIGNYGQKTYGLSVGDEKFSISYEKEKWDGTVTGVTESAVSATKKIANTKTNVSDISRDTLNLGYNINDNLSVMYNYYEGRARYDREVIETFKNTIKVGDSYNDRTYTTKQHVAQINYDDNNFKGKLFFNNCEVESLGNTYFSSSNGKKSLSLYNTREKNRTYGLDLQKNWEVNKDAKAILGVDYKNENFQQLQTDYTKTAQDYSRDNWGVYGQWEQKLGEKNTAIVSARETWTTGADGDQNFSNFSMAGQFIHQLDKSNNVYASVAQSFIMPTFAQMYKAGDSSIPNPGLKPQKGINYEIGWKQIHNNHNWKTAVYATKIKDNISASWDKGITQYQYVNEEFKNYGMELSCDIAGEGPFSYNWNVGLMNPKVKSETKNYWDRKFGRYQLGGGITYHQDKFKAALTGTFLGDRVQAPSAAPAFKAKPYFLTDLSASYAPDTQSEITLTIDNLLNRDDIVSHSSSSYKSTPINFLLNYSYKF